MTCERYQELISALLDGELSPDERAELDRHLSGCAECAALYEVFTGLKASLAEDLVEPPESIRENVMATLRREELLRRNRRRRAVSLAAMAACLALVVGLSLRGGLLRSARPAALTEENEAYAAAEAPTARGERFALMEAEEAEDATERFADSAAEEEAAPPMLNSAAEAPAQDAAEAPARSAAPEQSAASAQAVNQAAKGGGQTIVTVDQGIMRLDLSDWLSRQALLAFLGGRPVEEEGLTPVLLCRLTVSDDGGRSTVWLYGAERSLLYRIPGVGLYEADCNWAALLSFLSQGGSA